MKRISESKEQLVNSISVDVEEKSAEAFVRFCGRDAEIDIQDIVLTATEKKFLLSAERGDTVTVKNIISQYKDQPEEFNINCVDPLMRTALISAIENENIDLIRLLLEEGIEVKVQLPEKLS